MKQNVSKLKKNLQKAATFPLILFVCIVIVSFVAFFGNKYTVSQIQLEDPSLDQEVLGAGTTETEPFINECAFDEAPLDPCEQKGDLEMERLLVLKYKQAASLIPPGSGATGTCNLVLSEDIKIPYNLSFSISGSTAVVRLDVGTSPNLSSGCFSHHQFAIRDESGGKIDGYEEGAWHLTCQAQTYVWEKTLGPELQGRTLIGAVMKSEGTFEDQAAECQATLGGGTPQPPPPPSEPDPNPTWVAEWAATARIKNLPAFDYFASFEYPGTPDTDYGATPGAGKVRLMQGSVWSTIQQKFLDYDSTIPVDGYARLSSSSGLTGKPQYDAGNAVLTASMGDESDYTTIFRVPKQYIVEDKEDVTTKMDIESTHTSTFLDNIQVFWANIANYWDQFLFWLSGAFGDDVVCQGQFQIDELYFENKTSGYESLFENGMYTYDIYDIINKSDLIETTEAGECEKYEKSNSQCKIATGLSECNNCGPDPLDPTRIACDNIDYYTGQIRPDREDYLLGCLKGKEIFVWYNSEGFDDFQLAGGAYILETYWKKLQMLSPKRICHMKNLGIKVDVEGNLYDVNMATCSGETGSEECKPDPEYTCSRGVKDEMYAFFPYYGTAIFSASAYLDLQQAQYDEEVPDLPDCPEVDDKFMCYCAEDQADDVALYLYKIGSLTTKEEIAMTGFKEGKLSELVGDPVPPEVIDGDGENGDGTNGGTTPVAPTGLWESLTAIRQAVEAAYPGKCIPEALIAAIMAGESPQGLQDYRLDGKYFAENSDWCSWMNDACGHTSIPNNLSDAEINARLTALRQLAECSGDINNVSEECWKARTLRGRLKDSPHQCCYVIGIMQFDMNTWHGGGYLNKARAICSSLGINIDNTDPPRANACASIAASAIKLSANCSDFAANEELTVRTAAGWYVGGGNPNSSYANKVWRRYKSFPSQYQYN